jgi:hypothetical protein
MSGARGRSKFQCSEVEFALEICPSMHASFVNHLPRRSVMFFLGYRFILLIESRHLSFLLVSIKKYHSLLIYPVDILESFDFT